jgi:hypothetical protein
MNPKSLKLLAQMEIRKRKLDGAPAQKVFLRMSSSLKGG